MVFTTVKAVLIEPLPYSREWKLVQVGTDIVNAERSNSSWIFWNDAQELIRRTRTLESAGVYEDAAFDLAGERPALPEALYGLRVSASLFAALGVFPPLGRNILPEEDRLGGVKRAALLESPGASERGNGRVRDMKMIDS